MSNRPEGVGLRAAVLSAVAVLVMLLGGALTPALADGEGGGSGGDTGPGSTQGLTSGADGSCTSEPCDSGVPPSSPPTPEMPPPGPVYVTPMYPFATPATCSEPGHLTVPAQPTGVHVSQSGSVPGTVVFTFTHDDGYTFPTWTDATYRVYVEPRLSGALCHGTGPVYGGHPTRVYIPPIPAPPPLRWTRPAMPPPPRWAVRYPPGRFSDHNGPSYGGHAGTPTHGNGEHGVGTSGPSVLGTEGCRDCTTSSGQVPTNVEAGSAADRAQQAPLQVRTALLLTGAGGTFVLGVLALGLWRHRSARARG